MSLFCHLKATPLYAQEIYLSSHSHSYSQSIFGFHVPLLFSQKLCRLFPLGFMFFTYLLLHFAMNKFLKHRL